MRPFLASILRSESLPSAGALLPLAGLALVVGCKPAEPPAVAEIRPVTVVRISEGALLDTVSLSGTVQAQTEIRMAFRIDGRMIARHVGVGDEVRPGQVVARLDPQNEETSLHAARAQLAAADAQNIEARSNASRMRDLIVKNAVSRQSFEQAEALSATAQAAVASARSQVALAENRVNHTRLVSEVRGIVTAVGAEQGEVVRAGHTILEIATEGERDAVFDLPAALKDSLDARPEFTVALTMNPEVKVTAALREVSPRADPATGTFRIRLRLHDPPPAMRLGSTVTAKMQRDAVDGYVLPASALFRADGTPAVWMVNESESTVTLRPVQVRDFDAGRVIATGLKPGDIVVTAGVQALRPGQKVRLLGARQ